MQSPSEELEKMKRFYQKHRWRTKDGRKAVFVAILGQDTPAPLLFQVGGSYENYYLGGHHMPYPTDMDLVKEDFA